MCGLAAVPLGRLQCSPDSLAGSRGPLCSEKKKRKKIEKKNTREDGKEKSKERGAKDGKKTHRK